MESSKLRCGDSQAHSRAETLKVWATPRKSFSRSPSMASTTRKKTFWKELFWTELRTGRSVGEETEPERAIFSSLGFPELPQDEEVFAGKVVES